jgi:hypothetical protein
MTSCAVAREIEELTDGRDESDMRQASTPRRPIADANWSAGLSG